MELPRELKTNDRREIISFGIGVLQKTGVISNDFKLSPEGYDILNLRLGNIEGSDKNKNAEEAIIAIDDFIVGYALACGKFLKLPGQP